MTFTPLNELLVTEGDNDVRLYLRDGNIYTQYMRYADGVQENYPLTANISSNQCYICNGGESGKVFIWNKYKDNNHAYKHQQIH